MLDIIVALFIIFIIYALAWYSFVTERENPKNPIFHKDNKEIIYRPRKGYFDKLVYQDNDLNKLNIPVMIRTEQEKRTERLVSNHLNSSPNSSPIPRHSMTYGEWVISNDRAVSDQQSDEA